ncbi:uncharacterized protein LY89DRAFT_603023 [Mollisia scopiformis]|uniref:Uncharacterized protein n=1 Tax=Mollisia scopiformis TaxID=149040 RepID=A0A132B2A9_MOLSC|nr:uncharacterized protein LY89DRAFT_603023 [Mollisia scopiformis]KUJ06535.1 hypothetical protein LY89DRAFT_603023 [Mollisia scopiformis]
MFAIIILFVQATYSAEIDSNRHEAFGNKLLKTDVSTTLAVLRTAQGILSAITSMLLTDAFKFLQWIMMNPPRGLSYPSLLAISPTTGILGTLDLLRSSVVRKSAKAWALLRVSLIAIVWLSGLVLFFKTSLVTVYDIAFTYKVTAGVSPFNASLIRPFITSAQSLSPNYQLMVVPYTVFAAVYTLVLNPLLCTPSQSVKCTGTNCMSYLLSGGLEMVAPWVPEGYSDYPMVKIEDVPSIQLDFEWPVSDIFDDADCDVFGEDGYTIGIRLCIVEDTTAVGSFRAGLFVCNNGTVGGICHATQPANITSSISFYTREATVVAVRSNYSIISTSNLTPPIQLTGVDLLSYRESLRWLLNYTAANIPPPSSIAQSFWSSVPELASPSTYGIVLQNFQSVLAFPFWYFNSNNWANPDLQEKQIISTLPPQFYTQAYIVAPYSKLRFDRGMFILFLILQGLAIVFVWCVLLFVLFGTRTLPTTSSYPLYDIAFKANVDHEVKEEELSEAGNSQCLKLMKNSKAFGKVD